MSASREQSSTKRTFIVVALNSVLIQLGTDAIGNPSHSALQLDSVSLRYYQLAGRENIMDHTDTAYLKINLKTLATGNIKTYWVNIELKITADRCQNPSSSGTALFVVSPLKVKKDGMELSIPISSKYFKKDNLCLCLFDRYNTHSIKKDWSNPSSCHEVATKSEKGQPNIKKVVPTLGKILQNLPFFRGRKVD